MRSLAVAILLVAVAARADGLDEPDETCRPTLVHARLVGHTATFSVRYLVKVEGPSASEYAGTFELPPHGSLNRATLTIGGHRRALELRDATTAADAFHGLQGTEAGDARGWAVLLAKSGNVVQVGVAAPRTASLTFDLEITAPTCFANDVRFVAIPEAWAAVVDTGLRAQLTPGDRGGDACASTDGVPSLAFASPELARRPFGDDRIAGFAGRLALGPDQHVVRAELDLAGTLSEIPRDLATVFVVDGSRSMTAGQLEAQRALIAAYVAKAPESRVQVIAFARTPHPLLPGWMTAAQASARIDRELRALAPRNGSNVDLAIAAAGDWLARASGTRRMILIGDDALPARIDEIPPVTLRRVLPEHTLVHAIVIHDGTGAQRDDDVHFGPLATATEGMGVSAGAPDETFDITMLLRPITLDAIKVRAPRWTAMPSAAAASACTDDLALPEGGACTWWGHGEDAAGAVMIEGRLWGHRVVKTLQPDPTRHREVARELSADSLPDELSAAEQARVHAIAYAVNPAWSMYAAWGGSDGYADIGGSLSSCTCGGSSTSIGTIGHGVRIGAVQPPLELATQLAPAVAACKPGDAKIHATIETTRQETVDVTVSITLPHPDAVRSERLRACVEDAIWDVPLMIPHAPYRAVTQVALP